MGGVDIGIGEKSLDDILAIIKGSLNSEVVYVGVKDGSHLGLLDGRHLSGREHHEDRNIFLSPNSVDGCASGIS